MVVDIGIVRNYIKPKAHSTLYNMRKVDLIEYIRTLVLLLQSIYFPLEVTNSIPGGVLAPPVLCYLLIIKRGGVRCD